MIDADALYVCTKDHCIIDRIKAIEIKAADPHKSYLDSWVVSPNDIYHFTEGELSEGYGILEHLKEDSHTAAMHWREATRKEKFLHKLSEESSN